MNIYISLIITMVFSAFFSGVEIAFVSVDKLRFEMERKGGITSRILSIFFKNPNEFMHGTFRLWFCFCTTRETSYWWKSKLWN